MTTTKSLLLAALLSTVAAASFAQTPVKSEATKDPATTSAPATAAMPADAGSKPMHKKHHHHHHKHSAATVPADAAPMPMGTGKTAMPGKMHGAATPAAPAASK